MPRSVDQVKDIFLTFINIFHLDGVALDGDSFLPLQIHVVQHLRLHIPGRQSLCQFDKPVGKCALPMVDVSDDAEIPDMLHITCRSIASNGTTARIFLSIIAKISNLSYI